MNRKRSRAAATMAPGGQPHHRPPGRTPLERLVYETHFLDTVRTGFIVQDASGQLLGHNAAAARLLGDRLIEDGASDPWAGALTEGGEPFGPDELPWTRALRTNSALLDVVIGVDQPGEVRRWLSVDTYPLLDGPSTRVVSAFDDIDSQWHERHLLQLLGETDRVVMSASSESESLQRLCDMLVERGRFALVWIGIANDDESSTIDIAYSAGRADYLYGGIASWSGKGITGSGPSGIAIRTGEPQVANDLATHPGYEPWRERAESFGLRSSAAIPLKIGDRAAGLNVYSEGRGAFDQATVHGLQQIARQAGFAIAYLRSVQQSEAALQASIEAVEAQRATASALTQSEQRFRLAFENNMAPMSFADLNDRTIAVNNAFCDMVGYARDELIGQDTVLYTHPDDVGITEETYRRMMAGEVDHVRYVKRYLRRDGRTIYSEVSRSAARDASGGILYFVFSERDVTEERLLTEQLSHQAFHDPLTGLANRARFEDRLAQARARIVRQKGLGAVLLIDLDDFKGVNDTHGHLIGDQLLIGVAHRFEEVTRATDTLCRFGGDEFLYLAEDLAAASEAEDVAKRLLGVLAEPFTFGDVHLEQHASAGIVLIGPDAAEGTEIVQNADVALYEAKRQQRGGFARFTPSMHQQAVSRFMVLQELRHALPAGELSMHFQPILDLSRRSIVGFEALMRWQHPERGWIPPGLFIAHAEESDLILELGAFALHEAASAAARWDVEDEEGSRPFVAVNLSVHQFFDPDLEARIEETLQTTGLDASRLVLEITESVALRDTVDTLRTIEYFRRLGISIALDDFGTGYSSLSYLVTLHPKFIKIDQSFVRPPQESEQMDLLLETIVSLGHKLRVTSLAEGIETIEQLERLDRAGCELGQGFLFSPAVPADEVPALLGRPTDEWGETRG